MLYRSHRGNLYAAPENTMAAFTLVMEGNFTYVETDPQYTKDGEIVLLHDGTINRTCRNADGSPIEKELWVKDLTYEQLLQYDAGIARGEEFRGEKVPRLAELLQAVEGKNITIALDKKIPTENLDPLLQLVQQYAVPVTFSCADVERVQKVQSVLPNAQIDFDRDTSEETLAQISALVKRENLVVWLYLDKPNFAWLDAEAKTSPELCRRVKKYARLGIANVNNPYDLLKAMTFEPDVVEV